MVVVVVVVVAAEDEGGCLVGGGGKLVRDSDVRANQACRLSSLVLSLNFLVLGPLPLDACKGYHRS